MMNHHSFQVWKGLMRAVEWNKKEELVADQALRHLKVDHSLLHSRHIRILLIGLELAWNVGSSGGISLKSDYR